MIAAVVAAVALAPEGTGGLYGFLTIAVTQVCAVATLYLQGRKQHAANEERLEAMERTLEQVCKVLGINREETAA